MTATTIRCYGEMGRMFGRVHHVHLDTNTPAEAVRYLCSQFPTAKAYLMQAKDKGVGFAVFRGKENLTKEQLVEPTGNDDIRIAPIILGSKQGGVLQVILGVVLMVVALWVSGWSFGALSPAMSGVFAMGASMVVGGVVQMLTPMPRGPKNTDSPANQPSYVFTGAVNTQAQGNPVPLLYGRMIVGSAVISAGINAEDYAPATSGVGRGYGSDLYNVPGAPYGWNPRTPYDAAPALK